MGMRGQKSYKPPPQEALTNVRGQIRGPTVVISAQECLRL